MIETFYGQIKEFGLLIDLQHLNSTETVETYIVLGTQIGVYIFDGKPETITVGYKSNR